MMFLKIFLVVVGCFAPVAHCFRHAAYSDDGARSMILRADELAITQAKRKSGTNGSHSVVTADHNATGAKLHTAMLPSFVAVRGAAMFVGFALTTPEFGFPAVLIGGAVAVAKDGYDIAQQRKKYGGLTKAEAEAAMEEQRQVEAQEREDEAMEVSGAAEVQRRAQELEAWEREEEALEVSGANEIRRREMEAEFKSVAAAMGFQDRADKTVAGYMSSKFSEWLRAKESRQANPLLSRYDAAMRGEMQAMRFKAEEILNSKVDWIDATVRSWGGASIDKEELKRKIREGNEELQDHSGDFMMRALTPGSSWAWLVDVPAEEDLPNFQGTKTQRKLEKKVEDSMLLLNWATQLWVGQHTLVDWARRGINDPHDYIGQLIEADFHVAETGATHKEERRKFVESAMLYPAILKISVDAFKAQNGAKQVGGIFGQLFNAA